MFCPLEALLTLKQSISLKLVALLGLGQVFTFQDEVYIPFNDIPSLNKKPKSFFQTVPVWFTGNVL